MARKFWEKLGGNKIQFYDEPAIVEKDAALARIVELDEILNASDHIKSFIAQANPAITTEQEFYDLFEEERAELAERLDYWGMDTIVESVDVVDSGFFRPADGQLGPATVVAVSNDEVGFEAAFAIDGITANTWRSEDNPQADPDNIVPHDLIVDLGYKRRISAIRIHQGASPGNRLLLSDVNVFVALKLNGLLDNPDGGVNNPSTQVGFNLDFSNPADIVGNFNEQPLATRSGRFIRITIALTGHNQNALTFRDFEIKQHPRTFGI